MTRRLLGAVALAGTLILAGCGPSVEDGPAPQDDGSATDDGGSEVAEAPARDGAPGAAEPDGTVAIEEAVLAARDGSDRLHDLQLRIRNDGDTSRRLVVPSGSPPRLEQVDGGLRASWLRTVVAASDPGSGQVTYDREVPTVEGVTVAAGDTWAPDPLLLEQPGVAFDDVTELCLEVLPAPETGTPAATAATGDEVAVRAGWDEGEPILLACGPLQVEGGPA